MKGLVDRLADEQGTRLVVRPDSGDPVETVEKVVEVLMGRFGHRVNSKGYRVLPDHVRVLQGDGINARSLEAILANLKAKGISAENMVFGMGGGLLQQCDRDTLRFAMKCSAIVVNGEARDVYKDPVTDSGKASKKGVLSLVRRGGMIRTVRRTGKAGAVDLLRPVWKNGQLLVDDSFDVIRERAMGEDHAESLQRAG